MIDGDAYARYARLELMADADPWKCGGSLSFLYSPHSNLDRSPHHDAARFQRPSHHGLEETLRR